MAAGVLLACAVPLALYALWHALAVPLSILERRKKKPEPVAPRRPPPSARKVAILYVTCDDFDPAACATLLAQEGVEHDVFLLDDSTDPRASERIDKWARKQQCRTYVVRRPDRRGYKGGNINNWLARFGDPDVYPYFLLADADELVPPDCTRRLVGRLEAEPHAFAEACHLGTASLRTAFQAVVHPQVECEWLYQLPARNLIRFPPMLGHGVLLRTEKVKSVGGFPNVVSEDLGLTLLFAEKGWGGIVATDATAYEAVPPDYRAYWRRRRRWIQADAEVARKMLKDLWRSRATRLARVDLSLRELRMVSGSTYWLLLLAAAVLGLWQLKTEVTLSPVVWTVLPLFVAPALPALGIERLRLARRLVFVLTTTFVGAATSALHPVCSYRGLAGSRDFQPTGSRERPPWLPALLFAGWELCSGGFFCLGGVLGSNLPLFAVGLAIACSPVLRTSSGMTTLALGTLAFWGLVLFQIGVDARTGSLPLEHLLVLAGLAITLL